MPFDVATAVCCTGLPMSVTVAGEYPPASKVSVSTLEGALNWRTTTFPDVVETTVYWFPLGSVRMRPSASPRPSGIDGKVNCEPGTFTPLTVPVAMATLFLITEKGVPAGMSNGSGGWKVTLLVDESAEMDTVTTVPSPPVCGI